MVRLSEKPENISVPSHAAARSVATVTSHTAHRAGPHSRVIRRASIHDRASWIDIRQRIQRINLTHRWSRSTITHTAVTSYSSLACWRLSLRLAPVALGSTAGWISSCADSEKTCLSLAISRRDIRTLALTFYGFMHRFDPAWHRIAC